MRINAGIDFKTLMITDKQGKTLTVITLSGNGNGIVQVDASTLAAGAYQYSLLLNNKAVATK